MPLNQLSSVGSVPKIIVVNPQEKEGAKPQVIIVKPEDVKPKFSELTLADLGKKTKASLLGASVPAMITKNQAEPKEKPGFFKSLFKGYGMKLISKLPIIGTYKIGKELLEQEYLKEDIKALEEGRTPENKKPSFWKALGKGILFKLGQNIPIYGTYRIGKEMLEQQYMKEDLEAIKEGREPEHKKPKFFESLWKGIKYNLSNLIPGLNSYLTGKDMIEQDKMQEEVKVLA